METETETDPFDDLLSLEGNFYNEGFQLGSVEGATAGRVEGRVFGLEKGFEKFLEAGRLHGRSLIWAGRLPGKGEKEGCGNQEREASTTPQDGNSGSSLTLPKLSNNPRLEKHIRVLFALTEPVSLSTDNTDEAVSDFDDRLKRGHAKIKIIERLVGEEGAPSSNADGASGTQTSDTSIEDVNILKVRH
jgi:hypothetical protein